MAGTFVTFVPHQALDSTPGIFTPLRRRLLGCASLFFHVGSSKPSNFNGPLKLTEVCLPQAGQLCRELPANSERWPISRAMLRADLEGIVRFGTLEVLCWKHGLESQTFI